MSFLDVWIGYAIFGVTAFSAVFVWAVRSRQFTDLDRARYIALRSAEPIEGGPSERPRRIDRYTLIGLIAMAFGVVSCVLWIALR